MANVFQAFNYEVVELSFMGEEIDKNYIRYIIIESLYETKTMATMYISMHIPTALYQKISDAEKTDEGKFNLVLRAKNMYSETSIGTDYINGSFLYMMPSAAPDYSFNISNSTADDYKTLTLSFIAFESLDKLKSCISGIYNKIDVQDLLRIALQNFENVVVQMPTVLDLKKIETIVIPPMNNMKKLINFIFNVKPFYNTAFSFFADFSKVYLCAHDAETTASIDSVDTVIFHITDVTNIGSYYQGMVPDGVQGNYIEGSTYHIYLNPSDISISHNKGMDMVSDQIMAVEENGTLTEPIKLDYGALGQSSEHEFAKVAMRRGSNVDVYANMVNSNTVLVEIKKAHINGSIITPDKIIKVSFELTNDKDEFNAKYTGDYYLASKREVVRNNSGTFAVHCTIGMKKIGNLSSVVDTSEVLAPITGNMNGGFHTNNLASKASQTAKSNYNHSRTQSTIQRTNRSLRNAVVSAPNPNVKGVKMIAPDSSKYKGPEYIDTKSSGAVITYRPHIEEKKL